MKVGGFVDYTCQIPAYCFGCSFVAATLLLPPSATDSTLKRHPHSSWPFQGFTGALYICLPFLKTRAGSSRNIIYQETSGVTVSHFYGRYSPALNHPEYMNSEHRTPT